MRLTQVLDSSAETNFPQPDLLERIRIKGFVQGLRHFPTPNDEYHYSRQAREYFPPVLDTSLDDIRPAQLAPTNQILDFYGIQGVNRADLLFRLGMGDKPRGAKVVRVAHAIAIAHELNKMYEPDSEESKATFLAIADAVYKFGEQDTIAMIGVIGLKGLPHLGNNESIYAPVGKPLKGDSIRDLVRVPIRGLHELIENTLTN